LSVATGISAVVVELDDEAVARPLLNLADLPSVVIGVARDDPRGEAKGWVDVLLVDEPDGGSAAVAPAGGIDHGLGILLEAIEKTPAAATAFAMLLRGKDDHSIGECLLLESLVYSVLQAGSEFQTWLGSLRRVEPATDRGPAVEIQREDDELVINLTRPHVHNAFNSKMRDELVEALTVASVDPSIRSIVLRGEGPSFCSGGDLSEFGTLADPASAHLLRVTRNVARLMAPLRQRLQVRLHGACIGAGIELAAFAGRVTAAPDTHLMLPEVSMGLIPGAGGTVSIPRRVGRHRTAWLALSGARIDAATALEWGLVDEIVVPVEERPLLDAHGVGHG